MKSKIFFLTALCAMMLILFLNSCDKEEIKPDTSIVEEDFNGFDIQPNGLEQVEGTEYIETPMAENLVHHYNPVSREGDLVKAETIDGVTHKYFNRLPTSEELKNQYQPYVKDGKIFLSANAMNGLNARADFYDVRFNPQGHAMDMWQLSTYRTSTGSWLHVSWMDNSTVTVGLPYGDDDCGDYIIFRLKYFGYLDGCEAIYVKYYKNSSVVDSDLYEAYNQMEYLGRDYYLRVYNSGNASSAENSVKKNDCLSFTTHWDCY